MPIRVNCKCGKSLTVKSELAGKRIKCSGCGNPIAVVAPSADARSVNKVGVTLRQANSDKETSFDAAVMDAMLADEGFGEPTGETCPACAAKLLGGQICCPKCGYDPRSGAPIDSPDDNETQESKGSKHHHRKIAVICGGVALIASTAIGILMFVQSSGAEAATDQLTNVPPAKKVQKPIESVVNGTWRGVHDFEEDEEDGEIESWLTIVADENKLSGTFRLVG